MKINFYRRPYRAASLIVLGIFSLSLLLGAGQAHAIKMTMKRIVFEGTKKAEVLTIMNDTDEEQTYRIGWQTMAMSEDAGPRLVPDGERVDHLASADDMIAFAPRRVTVAPGQTQQIRLMLRKPSGLATGEYRSHLWVRPEIAAEKFSADSKGGDNAPSVQVKMLTGVSLPVFVRHGNPSVTGKITDLTLARRGSAIDASLILHRIGSRSLYGDFDFRCTGGDGEKVVHTVRGIAVYTETDRRKLNFSFAPLEQDQAACKTLRITYSADAKDPVFKGKIIAEESAVVQ